MNWKLIIIGAIAFYAATWVVSFATGPLIHNGVLMPVYLAHPEFWRPELNATPPNMAALLPYWITTGSDRRTHHGRDLWPRALDVQRSRLAAWLKYGFLLFLLNCAFSLALSGVFNLPSTIWVWWGVDSLVMYLVGGAVLGWVAEKVAPQGARWTISLAREAGMPDPECRAVSRCAPGSPQSFLTPPACPISNTSAGRRANNPTVTTPGSWLSCVSSAGGSRIVRPCTSRM